MRTNIVVDENLFADAFSVSQSRTKKELIQEALRELARLGKCKDLAELAGKIEFYKGFDHKKLRKTNSKKHEPVRIRGHLLTKSFL